MIFQAENEDYTTIMLSWEAAELIAHYYSFPTAVFLLSDGQLEWMRGKKRKDKKRIEELRQDIVKLKKGGSE